MSQRSVIRPVSAQPVLRTKKSLPSSLRSVVDIVSSQHAFADSPPVKSRIGGYVSSPRSAVTGNPISIAAQKQAEHYLQATTSSSAKNQQSIFEPHVMSSRSEVVARATSRSDGSLGDAPTSRSEGPHLEAQFAAEDNRNLRERLDQTVRQLNLLRDRHWSDSQELQKQLAQKTIEINRLETDARKRMGASLSSEDNLDLIKEQIKNRQLEAELASMKENLQSHQQRGSSETTANIQSMVQRFTEKVQAAEEKHAAIQKILDEKNASIRQLESKLLRRKEGRSGAIERMILARAKDYCVLTLSATFIVWKQGTILQKKENTDGILRFEKQQKEIEAVMQQSQKYRESLEAEKAALVRKHERLVSESKASEVQMQKDVKDMKQKLEESLRVAEQFHHQLLSQKSSSEDLQRGLEHQLDDIREKLSTAEGNKNAFQTRLLLVEKDLLDTKSLVDAQSAKIKMLSSENEDIFAEKQRLVEELSCKTQLLFQKDRLVEKLSDQEKQLKDSLDVVQMQQSQSILAEKNARRLIEIEIDNCIERICGFGTVVGDELVEGALDAAGVGHSLGAIKDQPNMILIGLMSKLSKMSVRMSFVPILWEHNGIKQKWKCLQKWKAFSKSSSYVSHLYSFQSASSLRAMKLNCFSSWKNSLRIIKRLYFIQKEKDRKALQTVFVSLSTVVTLLAKSRVAAGYFFQSVNRRFIKHYYTCWAIVTKRALLVQKQTSLKVGNQKVSRCMAVSFSKWSFFTALKKFGTKLCSARNFKLKKSIFAAWKCVCHDKRKLQNITSAIEGPACRKKQRHVLTLLSAYVRHKRSWNSHIKLLSSASDRQLKKSCFCGWNLICVSKRRLQDIFDQIEGPICQKIQRNVLVALSTYLSTKRRLSLLNGLSVLLIKHRASGILQLAFSSWRTAIKFSRFTAKSVYRIFKKTQDQHNFLVSQGSFRSWAIDVETLVTKRKQLFKRALQLAALRAFELWALIVFWNKKITSFASRRQHERIKRWRLLVAIKQRFRAQDAFIRTILCKRYELILGRFVFRLWVECTKVNLAHSKRKLAAIQQKIKTNQKRLQGAFMIWIRVKTTGIGVKRIISERLRKLFFRWYTFVEYRRSKSLLKSKLQQQSSPPSNAR